LPHACAGLSQSDPGVPHPIIDEGENRCQLMISDATTLELPMQETSHSILVVEDDPGYRELLELNLTEEGYSVTTAANQAEARAACDKARYDLVVCDLRLPGKNGIDVIKELKERTPETSFIVLTALGIRGQAAQTMKDGVDSYLVKGTMTPDSLLQAVREALERNRQRRNDRQPPGISRADDTPLALVGHSPAIQDIQSRIDRLSPFRSPVLITGEVGTGKELIARTIHAHSPSKNGRFQIVRVGSVPCSLLDSELFGHVNGAFPGADTNKRGMIEEAEGGTVFFHDVADLPQPLQPKILRVLQRRRVRRLGDSQEREVDVRIICATSRDLWVMTREGSFREDLLNALNVIHIHVPPLRERPEDIPVIAEGVLSRADGQAVGYDDATRLAGNRGLASKRLSSETLKALMEYPWHGNIRELESVLSRAALLSGGVILPEHLPREIKPAMPGVTFHIPSDLICLKDVIRQLTEQAERELITRALSQTKNNRTHAARLLGISHRSLLYKLKEYNIR